MAALVLLIICGTLIENDRSALVDTKGSLPSSASTIQKFDLTSRMEVVSRLQEILRIREEAYRSRRSDLLSSIYSRDCPCLSSDKSAIGELLRSERVWKGIRTSIEVREANRLNERVWTVVGLFRSETLYIKTEDGRLVETEPAGRDLVRFTLVKPKNEPDWLLGVVSVIQGP